MTPGSPRWTPSSYFCKRPQFSDDYYAAFNNDNVALVDTDGRGPIGYLAVLHDWAATGVDRDIRITKAKP